MVKAGLQGFEPSALVLDLEKLKYEWGDMMTSVFCAGQGQYINAEFPTAVVVSNLNREGLTSLVEMEMRAKVTDWLFGSLTEAFDAVDQKQSALIQKRPLAE